MRGYSLRSRDAGTPKKVHERDSPDKLDDADLDLLAKSAAEFMKHVIAKEQTGGEAMTAKSWREDFVPLEHGRVDDGTGQLTKGTRKSRPTRDNPSIKKNREPQGLQSGFEDELNLDSVDQRENTIALHEDLKKSLEKSSQDKLLAKSVLKPDLEKQHAIPPYSTSKRSQTKERKKIRDSKAGGDWYDMKATEMTPELANDLRAIRMRSVLDPKRFYRKNDMKTAPKFVQVGKVLDSPLDFYHSRLNKKDRKQTLVEELLADADTRRYNKRKYMELQIRRSKSKRRKKMLSSLL